MKTAAKGKKGQIYRILHYRDSAGKHRQKSLGQAQVEDAELIGEGVEVEFRWAENGQVELVNWPPVFGKQSEEEAEEDPGHGQEMSPDGDIELPERTRRHPARSVDEVQALSDGLDRAFSILKSKMEDVIRSRAFPVSGHPYLRELESRVEALRKEIENEWVVMQEDGTKRFREREGRWWGPVA